MSRVYIKERESVLCLRLLIQPQSVGETLKTAYSLQHMNQPWKCHGDMGEKVGLTLFVSQKSIGTKGLHQPLCRTQVVDVLKIFGIAFLLSRSKLAIKS